MTDAQGAPRHDRPQRPDPDATPVRGVPVVPPAPAVPASPGSQNGAPGGSPFAPPTRPSGQGGPGSPTPRPDAPGPDGPGAEGAAPGARPRPRNRAVAWTAAGVAAALVVVGGGLGVAHLVRDDHAAADLAAGEAEVQQVDLGAPEFDEVILDVAPTHEFSFPIEWALEDLPDAPGDQGVVQVFADPQLTVPARDAIAHVSWNGTISVSPPNHELLAFVPDFDDPFGEREEVPLNADGEWGIHDRYYIAEYRDRSTGEALPEPRVTAFTVDDGEQAVQSSVRVDDDGVAHFSWDAVDGADEYYVVRADDLGLDIIGTTSGTAWSSIEQDADVQEALGATDVLERDIDAMNQAFTVGLFGEDDAADGFTNDGLAVAPGFGVVAVTDGEVGPLAVQPGADLVSRLPAGEAFNAAEEMGVTGGEIETLDQLPTSYPVSLADGSTVVRPLTYDADGITEADIRTGTEDDAGNITITGSRIDYRIPYRVVGTMFTDTYTVRAPDMAAARAGARAADERAAAARSRTGDEQSYEYVQAGAGDPGDGDVVSRSAPEVPYEINGSNPLTTYLAANLVDGQRYVDVSAFIGKGSAMTPTGVSLWDAFDEALAQNPMALAYGRTSVGYSADQQLLSISYTGFDSEDARVAEQEAVAAAVDQVVGEIVTDGMSERDRAVAINDYLAANAEYDFAALEAARATTLSMGDVPHAWVATGVLIDGLGVCASYAQAYKALADAAGLENVYVTGTANVSGEGHAWNKVKVDGAWRVVDSTWNDSSAPYRYLLQTDAEAAADRTEDADWILDSRVTEFAAS